MTAQTPDVTQFLELSSGISAVPVLVVISP